MVEHLTNLDIAPCTTDMREARASNSRKEGGFGGKISGSSVAGSGSFFSARRNVLVGSPHLLH
jgi:hypothetical protein